MSDKNSAELSSTNALRTPEEWRKWKEEGKRLKRKWKEEKLITKLEKQKAEEDEAKTKKVKTESNNTSTGTSSGRSYTVSIALPGSILDNAQSPELRTYLAGQIARAAVVFNIDEIVVFDELSSISKNTEGDYIGLGRKSNCNLQLARILQYLECPQYLRKAFFPQHPDLKFAGLLNPLDTPHHVKAEEESPYREGIVLDKPVKAGKGSFVNVGLFKEAIIDKALRPGLRVTVKMESKIDSPKLCGKVVSPSAPRTESGLYWGYSVRLASSLGEVFTGSSYKGGYDMLIGTSERGICVDDFQPQAFNHALVVFGGVRGLESSLDADQVLDVEDPSLLFQHYINTCPNQGSHTIRTEEAILVSLAALRPKLHSHLNSS